MPDDATQPHTTVRAIGGLMNVADLDPRKNVIDPPAAYPARLGLRYGLSQEVLGRLERLAKARFYIRELVDEDISRWSPSDELYRMIVQSVNASSEIEGEHLQAEHLQLMLAAPSHIGEEHLDHEEKKRLDAYKSISEAFLWALRSDLRTVLTFDFIIELHKRMFHSTRPDIAGKIKIKDVHIRGAGYDVKTLDKDRAEPFLRALCDRTSESFAHAYDHAQGSMFLFGAEFVCDFLAIHPFADGNGRTARVLSTYLMERAGYHFARFYPLEQVLLETKSEYYEALFQAQKRWYQPDEDLTPWIHYFVFSVFKQWERAHQKVRDQSNREHKRGT